MVSTSAPNCSARLAQIALSRAAVSAVDPFLLFERKTSAIRPSRKRDAVPVYDSLPHCRSNVSDARRFATRCRAVMPLPRSHGPWLAATANESPASARECGEVPARSMANLDDDSGFRSKTGAPFSIRCARWGARGSGCAYAPLSPLATSSVCQQRGPTGFHHSRGLGRSKPFRLAAPSNRNGTERLTQRLRLRRRKGG
jgi:hypothetical protein